MKTGMLLFLRKIINFVYNTYVSTNLVESSVFSVVTDQARRFMISGVE
jgi:hypothetical protein